MKFISLKSSHLFTMSLEDHILDDQIDITPQNPVMDRDDEEEAEFNGTNEGDLQSNVQVEPTEEELKKAELKEKALKVGQ